MLLVGGGGGDLINQSDYKVGFYCIVTAKVERDSLNIMAKNRYSRAMFGGTDRGDMPLCLFVFFNYTSLYIERHKK